ncbi:phycobiliprotein lyase [Prochlorococcus marinus]|uniref:Chromophore lyase CpcS/CpeS n=1 Tax=Prochlorococcus marinus XMU1408 TaxID=2213228 RepID=A0A318R2L9_PROMR|nr:phycobiliprotein lyase [Prochlorococcus marinus]MBW3041369.1 phycobiliprotein lyase [Prochlorococcus marinus str. XMU1408]PYE02534.1 phycobiliprotein lyase [Prochlorococcus marinus XMU1408]
MNIDEFFLKSVGEWNSMRSGHSLAFQEFEEIRSRIKIIPAKSNDSRVIKLLKDNLVTTNQENKAFLISWDAKSEWSEKNQKEKLSGESILLPIKFSKTEGKIIRSVGYTEAIPVISLYKILEDGTLIIHSSYDHICTEERIWFVSNNLRSRSSVTKAINSSAILQTSYASEIRFIKK